MDPLQSDLVTELTDVRGDLANVQDITRPSLSAKIYEMEGHLTDVSDGCDDILVWWN